MKYLEFNGTVGCGAIVKIDNNNIYCGDRINGKKMYCKSCKEKLKNEYKKE